MERKPPPAETVRAVLVEAGHRCAIPTCRDTTTEIAHIFAWAETQDDSFENLIALCPTCHTRYDQKKEIDRKAIQMYKRNLSILNNRYSELERRLFEGLAKSGEGVFMLGAGGNWMVANAVKDGLFKDVKPPKPISIGMTATDGTEFAFPLFHVFTVTEEGAAFIDRLASGSDIA